MQSIFPVRYVAREAHDQASHGIGVDVKDDLVNGYLVLLIGKLFGIY